MNLQLSPQNCLRTTTPQVVDVFATLTGTGASAPTLLTNPWVTGISRTSAGLYVLTLAGPFVQVANMLFIFKPANGVAPASLVNDVTLAADAVGSSPATFSIQVLASTGAGNPTLIAADLASNDVVLLTVTLINNQAG